MFDISNTYLIILFIYVFIIYIMLIIKDHVNSKKEGGIKNLFNICLTIYLIGLVINILGINFFDVLPEFGVKLLSKFYCAYLFSFCVFLSSYYCINVFNYELYLNPNKNKKSLYYFLFYVISLMLIFTLPINIVIEDYTFKFYGLSVYYTVIATLISYMFVIVLFFKKIKNIDYFECFSPVLFFFLIIMCVAFQYGLGYSLYELAIVFCLVLSYFGIEKREEKVQSEISEAIIALEKGARFKTDFLSSMSHEIKTPLNSMLYTSRNITEDESVDFNVKREVNDIIYSSDTLQEIISNILMVNRIENDNVNFNKINYNIKSEIKTLPFVEKMKIDPRGVSFFIDISDDVPDLIYGEKEVVRLIIDNVLNYAVSYVKSGSLTLKLDWNLDPEALIIEVNNIEENIDSLYENLDTYSVSLFDCVQNADFGLGLASVLTNKLNGEIAHENEVNEAKIIFSIPHSKGMEINNFDNIDYKGLKVLVVDDVNLNLKIANNLFGAMNCNVDLASSGDECIDYVRRKRYDFIFLDIMMPNLNGEETLKKLKEIEDFNTPVIALTADEVENAKEKYLEKGFNGYIVKPFTKSDIVNALGLFQEVNKK